MGFILRDIPIWYGEISLEMIQEMGILKILLPQRSLFDKEESNGLVLPMRKSPHGDNINKSGGKFLLHLV
jgi:hypothetical protein